MVDGDEENPEGRLIYDLIEAHNLCYQPRPGRDAAEPGAAGPQLRAFVKTVRAILAYLPHAVPAAPRQVLLDLQSALDDLVEGRSAPVFDVEKKSGKPRASTGKGNLLAELAAAVTLLIRGRMRQHEALRLAGTAGKVSSKSLGTWRKNLPSKDEGVRKYYDLILEHFVLEYFDHVDRPIPAEWASCGLQCLPHNDAKQAGLRACRRIARRRSPIVV